MFELEACLQVQAAGYRVLFDFGNVVEHHPTNPAFAPGRDGDLALKCVNPSYNHALLLSKHTRGVSLRCWRLACLLLAGSVAMPGLAACLVAGAVRPRHCRKLALMSRCRKRSRKWAAGVPGLLSSM